MKKRQAKTIRSMPPFTRRLAKTLNEAQTIIDRLDNLLPAIQNLELDSKALWQKQKFQNGGKVETPLHKEPKQIYEV